ncbi:MAG TPA: HNH endonuclease [Sphingomonadaceae bacterium]|jgi:5-methylcytosine-specific restriction endonuclease McrA|nr:HNH endonuclease [Sphingomonadaceae bacterium]
MANTGNAGTTKKRRTPGWALAGWVHRLLKRRAKRAALRARDGDDCWRCGHKMRFDGKPNCGKAATVEHVLPLSRGGTWALGNLRLCHVGCNRHLAANTPEQKEAMRINLGGVEGRRN